MKQSLANLNGKTVVVTGASGYIGSELVKTLVSQSCNVIGYGRSEMRPILGAKSVAADIQEFETWWNIVKQADIIYHLAGNTSAYEASKNPSGSLTSTLLPITHLIKAAKDQQKKPRLVYASTVTIYGVTPERPVSEKFEPKPLTIYDLHKLFAEQQLALAAEQNLLESVSLRLANVYGPSSSISKAIDRGILNKFTSLALEGNELQIYGNGNYIRDYIYISDVVNAFMLAGITPQINGMSFNIASGLGKTLNEAVMLMASKSEIKTGLPVKINYIEWPSGSNPIEMRQFTADISEYKSATGWSPVVSFEDGLALMLDELLKDIGNNGK